MVGIFREKNLNVERALGVGPENEGPEDEEPGDQGQQYFQSE